MNKVRVAVNGYGNIGKRVADAIKKQPDMELSGVTKAHPDYSALEAVHKGLPLYAISNPDAFFEQDIAIHGSLPELLERSDVVIDCSPGGIGRANLAIYSKYPNLKVIFQGGEDASIAPVSFNAQSNFEDAINQNIIRVVSCNTTALCRILSPLHDLFGIKKARVGLVRRAADPNQTKKGLMNAWYPTAHFPSHHAIDVNTVLPDIPITSLAGIAPTTLMHGHMVFIEFTKAPSNVKEIVDVFSENKRVFFVTTKRGIETTAHIKDLAHDTGRSRGDIYEVCLWKDAMGLDEQGELGMHLAIDQQAIVIPENIDAIRAICNLADKETSLRMTDESLGMGRLKIDPLLLTV
jgi:glyceraldehyde-3-phosphate dehydrogenase (NAD(P))